MRKLFCAALFGLAAAGAAKAQPEAQEQNLLTRSDAVARALESDPGVAAAGQSLRAAEAMARQARLRPNPSLEVQLEDFGGSGPVSWIGIWMLWESASLRVPIGRISRSDVPGGALTAVGSATQMWISRFPPSASVGS